MKVVAMAIALDHHRLIVVVGDKFMKNFFSIKIIKNNKKGLTLIELMITVFVISIGLVGTMNLVQNTLRSAAIVRSNLTAAYLAQEGVELVRNIRDTNWINPAKDWNDGLLCPTGCQIDYQTNTFQPYYDQIFLVVDEDGFYRHGVGSGGKFKRKITTTMTAEDYLEIESLVSWEEHGMDNSITVINHLYDWR